MGTSNRCLTFLEEKSLRKVMAARRDAARDFAVFRALLTTGMRIGEFLSTPKHDAQSALAIERLFIPAARRKGEACDLFVYLRGEAREAFADLLKLAGDSPWLVPGRGDSSLTPRAFQLRLKQWAAVAGVDDEISPHWLRHTFAVEFCRKSEANPMETCIRLANRLGHADPRTCSHYLTMSRENDPGAAIEKTWPAQRRMSKAQVKRIYEGRAAA